jgi:hypothetical protein
MFEAAWFIFPPIPLLGLVMIFLLFGGKVRRRSWRNRYLSNGGCPNCQANVAASAKYCPRCGTRLPRSWNDSWQV